MRTFEEIIDDASVRDPFSNGFEGDTWMDAWCHRCTHYAADCPLADAAFLGYTPKEWQNGNRASLTERYRCTEFNERAGIPQEPKWHGVA